MNIFDNNTRRKTRFTTATLLASPSDTTAEVFVEASMMDKYNNLRKDLENEKQIPKYMESSGRIWVEECSRLRKDLN